MFFLQIAEFARAEIKLIQLVAVKNQQVDALFALEATIAGFIQSLCQFVPGSIPVPQFIGEIRGAQECIEKLSLYQGTLERLVLVLSMDINQAIRNLYSN